MRQPIKKRVAEANNITTNKWIYTLIVDGNNLLKISLVDRRMNDRGEVYGAVFTFIRLLGELLKRKDFNYCIVCWDGRGSGVLRWKYYEDYKANRGKNYENNATEKTDYEKYIEIFQKAVYASKKKKSEKEIEDELFESQKYIIQTMLEELCVRQYEFENVEGDDLIANYVKNKKDNEKIVIFSSDRDLTQLISENVCVYIPNKRDLIKDTDTIKVLGITHENIVLEKMLCGDPSDNIKGVKGVGQQTLIKYFPEIVDRKIDLDFIIGRSKEILEERKQHKQKPLKVLENIINGVTDGCQGDKLYEINRKIIDLSEPLLTKEAAEELNDVLYAPIDTSNRNVKTAYKIVNDNRMFDLLDETKFGDVLAPYGRIILMENKRYENFLQKCDFSSN
jgi:5'-3' exonuclease